MTVIIDKDGNLFQQHVYKKETDFEKSVMNLADQIFGTSAIYIDVKKRISGNDIISIPDGYVIDMTDASSPRLFIVENEIVSHDPFKHIGIQMLKFVTSFEDAKTSIRNFLMEEVSKNPAKLSRLEDGSNRSESRNVDNYLDRAVYSNFRGIVVIDEAQPELHRVLEKINANISVLELRTYEAADGTKLHQFDTLYDEFEEPPVERKPETPEIRAARKKRRAESDTIIVPAREDGFKEVFLGENQWYKIRIGAAMKEKIKYIAAYQSSPISAVTHIAEIEDIKPYEDSGKYVVIFKAAAKEIGPIKPKESKYSPQGPVYAKREDLLKAKNLEDAIT